MAHLGRELKNLRSELKELRINSLEGNQKPIDPNQKSRQNVARFCGNCRTNGHTPNYCRKKIRDEEIKKLQYEKNVTFTQDYNKRRGPSHGAGNWTSRNDDNKTLMSTPELTSEENFHQIVKIKTTSVGIDPLSERTIRVTTMIDTMISKQDHHTSQTKTNPENGEVIITIHENLQRHEKIHPSLISADNLDQTHLKLQCLIGLEIGTRGTIYPTTRNFQLPTTVTSQTWLDSLQQTMKVMNYPDYAL